MEQSWVAASEDFAFDSIFVAAEDFGELVDKTILDADYVVVVEAVVGVDNVAAVQTVVAVEKVILDADYAAVVVVGEVLLVAHQPNPEYPVQRVDVFGENLKSRSDLPSIDEQNRFPLKSNKTKFSIYSFKCYRMHRMHEGK